MSDDGTTVACPVEGCAFRDTASLVAAHVNGSADPDHDWAALRFGGPRDFLQQARRGWLTEEADDGGAESTRAGETVADGASTDADEAATGAPGGPTDTTDGTASDPGQIPVGQVRCPADGCHYTGELASVRAHVSGTHDAAHDSARLRERGLYPDADDVKGGVAATGDATDRTTPADTGDAADPDESTDKTDTADNADPADIEDTADSTATGDTTDRTDTADTTDRTDTTDTTTLTDAHHVTGDTTVAELLDLLESVESRDALPVDPSAVGTALVFCDLLAALAADPDTRTLVDAYTLASDLASEAGDARIDLRDELLARTDADGELAGELGRVRRVTRTRRTLKDDDEVLARLREAGVDEASVLRPDSKRVRETLEAASLPESLAFEVSESSYVQKADSDADARRARLAALRRRSEE